MHNHQAWRGGYVDHVGEVISLAISLYPILKNCVPFSLSDAVLVLFLHDLEKPWKYVRGPDGELRHGMAMQTKADHHAFRMKMVRAYGIVLTPEQENAVRYAEGELDDYSNRRRVMNELAAFCHMCDVASARIRYDYPRPEMRLHGK